MLTVKQDFSDAIQKKIDRDINLSTYFFLTLKSISQKLEDPSNAVDLAVNSIKDALLISPDKDRVDMIELVSSVASQNDRAKDVFVDTLENCACDYDNPKTCLAASNALCGFLMDGYTFKETIIETLHDGSLCDNQKLSACVLCSILRIVQKNESLAPFFVKTAEKALQSQSNDVLEVGCFLAADISSKKKEYADRFLPHAEALIDRKDKGQIARIARGLVTLAKSVTLAKFTSNLPSPYAERGSDPFEKTIKAIPKREEEALCSSFLQLDDVIEFPGPYTELGFDLFEKTIKAIPEQEEETLHFGYLQLGEIIEFSRNPKVAKRAALMAQEGSFYHIPSIAYTSKLAVLVYITKYEPETLSRSTNHDNLLNKPRALIS